MATCKDCLHYVACKSMIVAMRFIVNGYGADADKRCNEFKAAADFAPVVRCGNCRHFEHEFDGVGHCKFAGINLDHMETGFCSYGERRKENG